MPSAKAPKSLDARQAASAVTGMVRQVVFSSSIIELDAANWKALAVAVGDRVQVERNGDVVAATVTAPRTVTTEFHAASIGDTVRVRKPRAA